MEDVSADQLLRRIIRSTISAPVFPRRSDDQLLPADDTRLVAQPLHLLDRCVRIQRVHVPRRTSVSDEIATTREERSESHVDVAEDV